MLSCPEPPPAAGPSLAGKHEPLSSSINLALPTPFILPSFPLRPLTGVSPAPLSSRGACVGGFASPISLALPFLPINFRIGRRGHLEPGPPPGVNTKCPLARSPLTWPRDPSPTPLGTSRLWCSCHRHHVGPTLICQLWLPRTASRFLLIHFPRTTDLPGGPSLLPPTPEEQQCSCPVAAAGGFQASWSPGAGGSQGTLSHSSTAGVWLPQRPPPRPPRLCTPPRAPACTLIMPGPVLSPTSQTFLSSLSTLNQRLRCPWVGRGGGRCGSAARAPARTVSAPRVERWKTDPDLETGREFGRLWSLGDFSVPPLLSLCLPLD